MSLARLTVSGSCSDAGRTRGIRRRWMDRSIPWWAATELVGWLTAVHHITFDSHDEIIRRIVATFDTEGYRHHHAFMVIVLDVLLVASVVFVLDSFDKRLDWAVAVAVVVSLPNTCVAAASCVTTKRQLPISLVEIVGGGEGTITRTIIPPRKATTKTSWSPCQSKQKSSRIISILIPIISNDNVHRNIDLFSSGTVRFSLWLSRL